MAAMQEVRRHSPDFSKQVPTACSDRCSSAGTRFLRNKASDAEKQLMVQTLADHEDEQVLVLSS